MIVLVKHAKHAKKEGLIPLYPSLPRFIWVIIPVLISHLVHLLSMEGP